jgi:hypothetical protein
MPGLRVRLTKNEPGEHLVRKSWTGADYRGPAPARIKPTWFLRFHLL